jgi:hypothetical protein
MLLRALPIVLLAAVGTAPLAAAAEDEFTPLFDGQSLAGWVERGGQAKYFVEDGAIVGQSVPLTPNSFLCTAKEYGDFVLELEFKVDPRLNSGVQIRSQVFDKPTTIKTWLNGEPRADFRDDLTPRGFIALQVHGVGAKTEKLQVRWRSIRLREVQPQ